MKRWQLYLLAFLLACLQVGVRGVSLTAIFPNICIIALVFLAPRIGFADLAGMAILMGVLLETHSVLPFGSQLMVLLFITLFAKLVMRSVAESGQILYLIILSTVAVIVLNVASFLSLPLTEAIAVWRLIVSRIVIESLYNGTILLLLSGLFQPRQNNRTYRLPIQ